MWAIYGKHVIPLRDEFDHITSMDCDCQPFVNGNVIVHNSWDRREFTERRRAVN
jgi:hypothetical protein